MRRQPSDSWHGASTLKKIFGAGETATPPPCTAIEKLLRLRSTRGVPGLHLNWPTHPTHVLHYVTSAWQKHGCKDGEWDGEWDRFSFGFASILAAASGSGVRVLG